MELKDMKFYDDPVFGLMEESFKEYSKLIQVVICAGIIISELKSKGYEVTYG